MRVNHRTDGETTLIELHVQDLDIGIVGDIKAQLESILGTDSRVILDLEDVEFMDSSGAGLLVWLRRRLQAASSELVLCGLSPQVHLVLESLQFSRIFVITGNREEAKLIDPTSQAAKRS